MSVIMHRGNGEQVLLVDDEDMLVTLGVEQLKRLGYHATGTIDPQQALQLIKDDPTRWHIVISDFTMPRMSGIELARAIYAIRTDLPILLSSGYGVLMEDQQITNTHIVGVLDKPVDVAELARSLHKHLSKE